MGAGGADGPRELQQRVQVLHDLLVQFDPGQNRQQLRTPRRGAFAPPALAGTALAQVPRHGQPEGGRQHHDGPANPLVRIAVRLGVSQYLPQFPAPGSAARCVQGRLGGGERGNLDGAQYRLPVLAAQPPNLGDVSAKFQCRLLAVQATRHEQVEEPLPGFGQRGHDLPKPVPQRFVPGRRLPRVGNVGSDVGVHRFPVDVIDPGGAGGRESVDGDAKQPAPQPVRTRQLCGVGHCQAGGNENVTGGGDCRISIGP